MSSLQLSAEECIQVLQAALPSKSVTYQHHRAVLNVPDGFNGLYYTLRIDYRNESDSDTKQLSCFSKSVPHNERHLWYIKGSKLLLKEYEMYQKIIPRYQKSVNFDIPVPKCYFVRQIPSNPYQDVMIMEDLKEQGFIMRNPRESMGYTECSVVMKAIAKLHASCVVFQTRSNHSILDICQYPDEALWNKDPHHPAYPWVQSSIDTLIELAEKMPEFATRLASTETRSKFTKSWMDTYEYMTPSKKFYNVITHGDIWSNNLMFKYSEKECIDVRIIDLQVYRYVPPITDVLMFIYLNTTRDFREHYKQDLIEIYAETLRRLVEDCGCDLPLDLTLQGLKEQEREYILSTLITASGYVPMGQLPPEARVNINDQHNEGERDFDVLYDFLNSRSEQVWRGMQIDPNFNLRVRDALDELLLHLGL